MRPNFSKVLNLVKVRRFGEPFSVYHSRDVKPSITSAFDLMVY